MRFALDYDGTYSAAPEVWDVFIDAAQRAGHEVSCVTMRFPEEPIQMAVPVIYTGRVAKLRHCAEAGIAFDVWIDDAPHWLFQDAA